jgi:hypothetical protein
MHILILTLLTPPMFMMHFIYQQQYMHVMYEQQYVYKYIYIYIYIHILLPPLYT